MVRQVCDRFIRSVKESPLQTVENHQKMTLTLVTLWRELPPFENQISPKAVTRSRNHFRCDVDLNSKNADRNQLANTCDDSQSEDSVKDKEQRNKYPGACLKTPLINVWKRPHQGLIETRCRFVEYCNSYIPFNPYTDEEEERNRRYSKKSYETFYTFPMIDREAVHELQDGTTLPLYRWNSRHWIFRKFDDGIAVHIEGLMEITPELVAEHIARSLRFLSPSKRDNQKLKPTSYRELENVGEEESSKTEKCPQVVGSDSNTNGREDDTSNRRREEICPVGSINRKDTVIEGCCGYGGNTIQLATLFNHVIGIDIDAERLKMAERNASIYGVGNKIEWVHHDFNEWCDTQLNHDCRSPSRNEKGYQVTATNKLEEPTTRTVEVDHMDEKNSEEDRTCMEAATGSGIKYNGGSPLYPWAFLSPPWGGKHYKEQNRFRMRAVKECNIYEMIKRVSSICSNICIYLPPNQDINEVIELSAELPSCCSIILESISIGLRKHTKYLVVKFLDEETSKIAFPNFYFRAAQLLVDELEEQQSMIHSFLFLFEKLGVREMCVCLQKSIKVSNEGGMVRLDSPNEERTKGGIFFQIIKLEHPETYRNLNKFRKAYVFKKRLNKSKKSARDPGNLNNKRFDQEAQLK